MTQEYEGQTPFATLLFRDILHFTKSTNFSLIYSFLSFDKVFAAKLNGFVGRICRVGAILEQVRNQRGVSGGRSRNFFVPFKIFLPRKILFQTFKYKQKSCPPKTVFPTPKPSTTWPPACSGGPGCHHVELKYKHLINSLTAIA